MSLITPATHCIICGKPLEGRPDKIFCSVKCKSAYHIKRNAERKPISHPTDSILHRNWVVLQEAFELAGKKKFFVGATWLQKEGFKPQYHTSTSTNQDGKTYRYIYDFAWMQFTQKELMVIKLNKPR